MFLAYWQDIFHIRGQAIEGNRQNGLGFLGDRGFDPGWINIKAFWLYVNKNRLSAAINNSFNGGHKCKGGCNNFIARSNAAGPQGQVKAGSWRLVLEGESAGLPHLLGALAAHRAIFAGRGRLNVVSNWGAIEAGVFEGKRFQRRTFVRHLKTRADRIEREKKRKDDDDD